MKSSSKEIIDYFDYLAKDYDSFYKDKLSQRENRIVEKRLREIADEKDILDLGCGTGLTLSLCNPLSYLGVDISPNMIKIAKNKYPKSKFIIGDLNNEFLEKLRSSYDVIISLFSSLSYVPDLNNVLLESKRLLREEGKLYFMVLQRKPQEPFINKYEIRNSPHTKGIISYFYTKKDLENLLEDWGDIKIKSLGKHTLIGEAIK